MTKEAKSIAQLAIMNWVKTNLGQANLNIEFTGKREAYVTDESGDSMTLIYDGATKEVYAV